MRKISETQIKIRSHNFVALVTMTRRRHFFRVAVLLFFCVLTQRPQAADAFSGAVLPCRRSSLTGIRLRLPRRHASSPPLHKILGHFPSEYASRSKNSITWSKKAALLKKVCFPILLTFIILKAPAHAASRSASSLPAVVGTPQVLASTALVSLFGGFIMSRIGLDKLAGLILAACARATVQLFLLGAFVLQTLFGTTRPAIVWAWIVGVGLVAAGEASSRVEYTYDKLRWHVTLSVLIR